MITAIVGLENRSTLDIDAAIKNLPLSVETAIQIVENIISIPIDDGMVFSITGASTIMSDADYAGVRIQLNAMLEKMQTPLKIDFSTGEAVIIMLKGKNAVTKRVSELPQSLKFKKYCSIVMFCNRGYKEILIMALLQMAFD